MALKAMYTDHTPLFEKYGIQNLRPIAQAWQEKHRYYHTEAHLNYLIKRIEALFKEESIGTEEREILLMVAFFHDIVYDPRAGDNEEKSAQVFLEMAGENAHNALIEEIILDTKHHKPKKKLSKQFSALDMEIVSTSNLEELMQWERNIFREYQFLDYAVYRPARLALLNKFIQQFPENAQNLTFLTSYVEQFRPRVGVYPGSFNPFHNGHLNILEKAEAVFDKVIIARGVNPDKEDINANPLDLNILKYRQTESFQGFLTHYISSKEKMLNVTLVRGLRNGDDLDYEVNQLRFMEDMKPDLKVVFIPCDQEFEHISSSSIKNLDKIDPSFSQKYIPS